VIIRQRANLHFRGWSWRMTEGGHGE
jgi:hypothetical protein